MVGRGTWQYMVHLSVVLFPYGESILSLVNTLVFQSSFQPLHWKNIFIALLSDLFTLLLF